LSSNIRHRTQMPYKDRKNRIVPICDWGTIVHLEEPACLFKAKRCGVGLCKLHFDRHFKKVVCTKCIISSCENERDPGAIDNMCEMHGILNGRGKCGLCGETSSLPRCSRCRGLKINPCVKCKANGTKDFFGRHYCRDHYPERKICVHVTREQRCRKMWYDKESDGLDGKQMFCSDHGGARIVNRRHPKYSGRCCKVIPLAVPKRCRLSARNVKTKFCKRHDPSKKCRLCDKAALAGYQQLCESHVQKDDALWCPICNKGITHRYLKCCK
jgi:hypothetical protein